MALTDPVRLLKAQVTIWATKKAAAQERLPKIPVVRGSITLSLLLAIDDQRDRAVVDKADSHMLPEAAGSHFDAGAPHRVYEDFIQPLGQLRRCGGGKTGASAAAAISQQCELAHDEHRAAHLAQRQVHFAGFVFENAQSGDLLGQPAGVRLAIFTGHAQKYQKTTLNPADDLARHVDVRLQDSLNAGSHGDRLQGTGKTLARHLSSKANFQFAILKCQFAIPAPACNLSPMWPFGLMLFYCSLIIASSLLGGFIPLWFQLTHIRLQIAMSVVGGAMLGVGLLNLLPHALYAWEPNVVAPCAWLLAGFLFMFFVERVFHFHHHDAPAEDVSECELDKEQSHADHAHRHAHPPRRLTWGAALAGLALHSALDGVALAASVRAEPGAAWGGFVVFLVIVLHKPFDSLTLGTLMAVAGRSAGQRHLVNALYATAVPLGAVLYNLVADRLPADEWHLTGSALAFAAGTFLCIATSDLLPELQFHSHDRLKLSIALLAGVSVAAIVARIEEAGHSHQHRPSHGAPLEGHGHTGQDEPVL